MMTEPRSTLAPTIPPTSLGSSVAPRSKAETARINLAKAHQARIARQAAGIKTQRTMPAASVLLKAIKANRIECSGPEDPNVEDRIRACPVPGCALRPYRPFQGVAA